MRSWSKVQLGSRCEVFSGCPFKSAQFTENPDDVALVKGENVGQGQILWALSKRWPREDGEDLVRYRLEPDDVVLAMDRPWVPAGLKFARIRASDPEALLVQRSPGFAPSMTWISVSSTTSSRRQHSLPISRTSGVVSVCLTSAVSRLVSTFFICRHFLSSEALAASFPRTTI